MRRRVVIDHVTKQYGDFKAVDNVSVSVNSGEFFTLLGPSGCGKTTLLRMIAGFNTIDGGEIRFDETVINDIPAYRRNIGMVFQNYAIFPHMSVEQNVAYGLKARRIKGKELQDRVLEGMRSAQIEEYAKRQPSQLSGGQQQRVALARAIVIHPEVLLMDEPLSNLDAKLRLQMRTSIKRLQNNLGITTIYVTHDQEEALAISDRIAVMNQGVIQQIGTPRDIYLHPVNRFVADFIGTMGFIKGKIVNGTLLINDQKKINIPLKRPYEGEVMVAVRPEQLLLRDEQPNELAGTIALSTFLGNSIKYEVALDNGPTIEVDEYSLQQQTEREIGQRVSVMIDPQRMNMFDRDGKEALI